MKQSLAAPLSKLLAALAAFSTIAGCGSVASPKDVDVTKLKPAMDLQVLPGDGEATLSWVGNNNEDDFSGYNIYVSQSPLAELKADFALSADPLDPQRFAPLAFRDAKEGEIESLRASLSKHFNYDEAAKKNAVGDGKKWSPLVRCNVAAQDADGPCLEITEANKAHEEFRANGKINYVVKNLANGSRYTFFVAATLDAGKKIASPTSSVLTVTPRKAYGFAPSFAFKNWSTNPRAGVDLEQSDLAAVGSFSQVDFTAMSGAGKLYCLSGGSSAAETSVDFYFEKGTDDASNDYFVTGANGARIADLGPIVKPDGSIESSALLANLARLNGTALVPPALATAAPSTAPLLTDMGLKAGYSVCGQSVLLKPYRLYAIAYAGKIGGADKIRYALLETGASESAISTMTMAVGFEEDRKL